MQLQTQVYKKMSRLGVRHMFPNVFFTAEYESNVKIDGQMKKKKNTTKSSIW